MLVITALRSFLPAQRRGTICVLLIAVVIAGLVAMHSLCGSPAAAGSVATPAAGETAHHAGSVLAVSDQMTEPLEHHHEDGCQCGTTTSCLMVLVSLLTPVTPSAAVLNGLMASLADLRPLVAVRTRTAGQPSFYALGVCRT